MSVKVKFSLSKEWKIVIKNPLLLLLECFSTQKHIVLHLTPTKSGNPLFYIWEYMVCSADYGVYCLRLKTPTYF